MISLHTTEAIITTVLLFFAYIFSITLSGNIQAYVAKWMGDDTADKLGFTEFNPFIFIDTLSIVWFIVFQLMMGQPIPIRLSAIKRSWWPVRVFLTFGSPTICNFILAVASSVGVLLLCGPMGQIATVNMSSSLQILSMVQPNASTIKLVLCMFLGVMAFANILLATLSAVRQTIFFIVMYQLEKDFRFIEHANILIACGPLLVVFFFGNMIFSSFLYIIGCTVMGIGKVCGVA
jgi:hypothetical protein